MTTEQLHAAGLAGTAINYRVKAGRLYREHHGVYGVGRPAITPVERAAAAVLACGPGAALSHGSAMTLWGFWKRWDQPFEVLVPADRRPARIRAHRTRTLHRRDVARHLGIRVTTPARTIVDIAPRLGPGQLKRVIEEGLASGYLGEAGLADVVARLPRHRGAARLRPFLNDYDDTRSRFEDGFPAFCERFGLPRPIMNARVGRYTVDALFPRERVIVELDSWGFHSSRESFEDDRERDADHLAADLVTVRITWRRLERERAGEAERLRAILARRHG